ncbi:MAG: type II toxin-antitoxin system RelE/ParE family toxin [bacterium]|nr:type II toxin-antitoxin system RelE/ParE family toxin [bacterium]
MQERILAALDRRAGTGHTGVKHLQGRLGEYGLRVGRWRVFYHLDDPRIVAVFRIDNRSRAY